MIWNRRINVLGRIWRVAAIVAAIALAGCGRWRSLSERDAKQAVEQFMRHENGGMSDERSVSLIALCSKSGNKAVDGKFQEVRAVEIGSSKRVPEQGLYHWYAATVWPVRVELGLECKFDAGFVPLTATQEFELGYDDSWKVQRSYWLGPEVTIQTTETDPWWWELYAGMIAGFVVGLIAAAAGPSGLGRAGAGILSGGGAGMLVAAALGIYAGFRYHIFEYDSSPGFGTALWYGGTGLFVGMVGGILGSLGGTPLGILLAKARSTTA